MDAEQEWKKNFSYPLYFEMGADLVYPVHSPNLNVRFFLMLTQIQFSAKKTFLIHAEAWKRNLHANKKKTNFPNENNFLQLPEKNNFLLMKNFISQSRESTEKSTRVIFCKKIPQENPAGISRRKMRNV